MTARIELVGADDQIIISGGTGRDIDGDGTILGLSPSGIFGTAFTSKLIHASGQIGAREGGVDVPARQIVLPLDLWDTGAGVAATVSRLRKMFGTMLRLTRMNGVPSSFCERVPTCSATSAMLSTVISIASTVNGFLANSVNSMCCPLVNV